MPLPHMPNDKTGLGWPEPMPVVAKLLGWAGVLPFAISALGVFFLRDDRALQVLSLAGLTAYGAVILSFLGGVRWGTAMARPPSTKRHVEFVLSIVPSLVAWVCLLVNNSTVALGVLTAGFIAMAVLDYRSARAQELPSWYGHLRVLLSMAATISLLFGLISLL